MKYNNLVTKSQMAHNKEQVIGI